MPMPEDVEVNFGTVEIAKTNDEERLVFGWAYVSHDENGEQIIDKSGDHVVDFSTIEKAAYDFVLTSRDASDTHIIKGVGTMVESVVFTKEKTAALGIPDGILPAGWWVGYKVHDDRVWKAIKDGTYTSFSVHGKGVRKAINA